MEEHDKQHVTSYYTNGVILVVLLFLTFFSVFIAEFDLKALTLFVAISVATVKGSIVVMNFMHLRYEKKFTKYMVLGVFVLFAIVLIITFFDYWFR